MTRARPEGRYRGSAPPRSDYHHAKWHDWWVCRACGAVVEDWEVHDTWHEGQPALSPADAYQLEMAAREHETEEGSMEELRDRARAEGNAVVEVSAWRQVRDIFRLRPPREA